jgi:uncharacterized membrane protein
VVVLPFHLAFDPAGDGLGVVERRRPFADFAADQALLYGLFAVLLAPAFAGRLLASARPARAAALLALGAAAAGSLLAWLADLAGVLALALGLGVAVAAALSRRVSGAEQALWLLVAGGLTCLLVPEVVYVRDAFDGGPLERMNTVFKLGYQAWLLLAVAGTVAAFAAVARIPRAARRLWALALAPLLALAAAYPYAGTWARKEGFDRAPTLDGLRWLARGAPGDVAAMAWLRAHAPGDSVVLESAGDDYSPAGHARISTFTGLATVLGWPGHELQWEHDAGGRPADVARAYRTADPEVARALLERYRVRYVVVGPLERADHGDAGVPKWDRLGRRVLERDGTIVWEVATGRT